MFSVFCDSQNLILADFLFKSVTIMGAYYANLIYKLQEAIKGKLPGSLSKGIPLNRDNAPSRCKVSNI